ncbi:MAG: VanZ family protein [Geminicoccaceae bacterium]
MSDVIKTGSKRNLPRGKKTRAEAIGKKRKIDRSKDELELGRFVGEISRKPGPDDTVSRRSPGKGEVVGPKRRNVNGAEPKAERKTPQSEMRIAAPLAIDDEVPTRRPRARRRSQADVKPSDGWGRRGALALLGILLVTLTAATFMLLPRYQPLGAPLLADPGFEAGLTGWQQAGSIVQDPDDPARVTLESQDAETRTRLVRDIDLPPGDTLLVLRAQVQGENVVSGPEIWESARIYLARLDADGQPDWKADHDLFDLAGTTDIRNYSRAFSIPAEVETVRLGIELKNTTGRLTVSQLELIAAERPRMFVIAAGGLLLAWGALILYTAIRTLKGIRSASIRLWLGIVFALSIAALMLPGHFYEIGLIRFVEPLGINVDAAGHGIMFALLALLVRMGRPFDPFWLHVGAWSLIAVASEVLQLFTFDREPSMDDLWADGLGIFIGLVLAETARRMRRFSPT